MAAFELNSDSLTRGHKPATSAVPHGIEPTEKFGRLERRDEPCEDETAAAQSDSRRIRQECIIALKVYDSCRQQECLDGDELGPARAAETTCVGDRHYREGEIIDPPNNAAAVTIDRLRVKKIIIVDKKPNQFKRGFWDIDIKYVFEYRLIFREADGEEVGSIRANSIFNKSVTLFGSVGSDIVISTDLFNERNDESPSLGSDPFVLVEAKPVSLAAKLKYTRRRDLRPDEFLSGPNEVIVTIGLFTIIKVYRIVQLLVESRGFCIPNECENQAPINICDFFERLDFPMDVFAPPQKPEFESGLSGNIPRAGSAEERRDDCV